MPAKVKVRILAGRNLPVMDKSSDASDAFVEVKLGNTTYKTEVYRRSLNPFWNSEWFRFEVSDQELQDEPLQIRIMDYDTYSANDAIGKVYINLNPLLINPGRSMSGWLPIYDTLHGIRGEIHCMVKVNLFADNNRYRHSSCGVRFFFSDIPNGYKCDAILGFVDELLVNDDPEYQWIDKIRTPRASNEARQTLFTKLSGEVQRKLGLKAEVFGGNAVIGYKQSFDLEGGSGIVGRGIGTAVVLSKIGSPYEGIISPVQMSNQSGPHPYFVDVTRRNRQDRSNRSYYIHKNPHPERHLVHSISADYFYEVPSNAPRQKRLSSTLESSSGLSKQLTTTAAAATTTNSETVSDEESHESDYEDCEETLSQRTDELDDSCVERTSPNRQANRSSLSSASHSSPTQRKPKFFKLNPNILLLGRSNNNNTTNSATDSSGESRNNNDNNDRTLCTNLVQFKPVNDESGRSVARSNSFLRRLRQSNELISQTVSNVITKPLLVSSSSSSTKLTKLLSLRRPLQHQQPSISSNSGKPASFHQQRDPSESPSSVVFPQKSANLAESSTTNSHLQQETLSSANSEESSQQSNGSSSMLKRRRDKSQSASLDDALSIIEERLDDDLAVDSGNQQPADGSQQQALLEAGSGSNPSPRARLLSGSGSAKFRPMLRAKEIDLNDAEEEDDVEDKGEDYDVDEQMAIERDSNGPDDPTDDAPASSSTPEHQALQNQASEATQLSSSSPSTSVLTDETVKANDFSSPGVKQQQQQQPQPASLTQNQPPRAKFAAQLSTPAASSHSASHHSPTVRRSDTDLTQALATSANNAPQKASSNQQLATTTTGSGAAAATATPFAQSVRAVRAQQHLLQTMIKHQNQNLLYSSASKAKNAFMYPNRVHQSEYPFVTLKRYPACMIQCTGGVVSVHSVKLLDHIINDEESETRDVWWTEIRKEIRSHAKALNCNTILGYSETSKVIGDVCVLSACGTAAILRSAEELANSPASLDEPSSLSQLHQPLIRSSSKSPTNLSSSSHTLKVPRLSTSPPPSHSFMPPPPPPPTPSADLMESSVTAAAARQPTLEHQLTGGSSPRAASAEPPTLAQSSSSTNNNNQQQQHPNLNSAISRIDCSFCHTSLACVESVASLANCTICHTSKVPDVLLLTIEPPQNLNIASAVSLVQARVCRAKRDTHGEANAKEIGEALPFLEYELHRQLFTKLKFKGMNCLFNLSVDISVGESMITGVATGTGCFVLGLPEPEAPQISAGKGIKTSKLNEIQRLISLSAIRNRETLGLDKIRERLTQYHAELTALNLVATAAAAERLSSSSVATGGNEFKPLPVGATNEQMDGSDVVAAAAAATASLEASQQPDELLVVAAVGHRARAASQNKALKSSTSSEYYLPHPSGTQYHRHHKNHHYQQQQQHHSHHHRRPPPPLDEPTTENLLNLLTDDNNIVLEVDDNEDAEIIAQLIDNDIPAGYLICNSESAPTIQQSSILSINMFTQVMRVKLAGLEQFAHQFEWIMQALFVKLRRSLPCCLTNINFVVDLPETNVVQISVTGCLLGLNASPDAAIQNETPLQSVSTIENKSSLNRNNNNISSIDDHQQLSSILSSGVSSSKLVAAAAAATGQHHQYQQHRQQQQQLPVASTTSTSSTSSSSSSTSSSPSTTTPAPISSSQSSLSSAASPASSESSSSTSSAASTATKKSTKDSNQQAGHQQQQQQQLGRGEMIAKSITKQLSKTNIAALISGKKKSPSREATDAAAAASIELSLRSQQPPGCGPCRDQGAEQGATRAAVVAAVKESLPTRVMGSQLGEPAAPQSATMVAKSMRAVFKKQQTYPGAHSPQISGHDRLLPASSDRAQNASSAAAAASSGGSAGAATPVALTAAQRATIILNKVVKQPLKDLGSNFNSSQASASSAAALGGSSSTNHHHQADEQLAKGLNSANETTTTTTTKASAASGQHRSSLSSLRANYGKSHNVAAAASTSSQVIGSGTESAISGTLSPATAASNHQDAADATQKMQSAAAAAGKKAAAAAAAAASNHNESERSINSSIDITSLSYIPGAKEYHYLGNLSFSFVRETNSVRENGGLNGFIHCFLMEVYAIVRAHVSALGGNAFLSFRLQQSCIFYHSNKNQAQCLISVAGDAVQVAL